MQLRRRDPEKFKALNNRMTTPLKVGGPCPPPSFNGSQEFFHNFIITAKDFSFNCHLRDVFISQIILLNDQDIVDEEGWYLRNNIL